MTPEFVRSCLTADEILVPAHFDDKLSGYVIDAAKNALLAGRMFCIETTVELFDNVGRALNLTADPPADGPYRDPWLSLFVAIDQPKNLAVGTLVLCAPSLGQLTALFRVEECDGKSGLLLGSHMMASANPILRETGARDRALNVSDTPRDSPTRMTVIPECREGTPKYIAEEQITGLKILRAYSVWVLNGPVQAREFELVEPPPALNRARQRSGKPAYPAFNRVNLERYITTISKVQTPKTEYQGGTHASPLPHLRRGHYRIYKNGLKIFIKDTTVKVPLEERSTFLSQRDHYQFKVPSAPNP